MIDYYELLQISPNADGETIHRVYRYLAARLHPDNANTGDAAKFQDVKTAYDVLSRPTSRNDYDVRRRETVIKPLSLSIDFMDQLDGENNRRIAVLALLYDRRRKSPNSPQVSLAEIEERMGFPRDYLDFTLWYLARKDYISKADNACYSLTAEGVDWIEKERIDRPVLNGLLTTSVETEIETAGEKSAEATADEWLASSVRADIHAQGSSTPARRANSGDRRSNSDRRTGEPDLRNIKVEKRQNAKGRRENLKSRRAPG